MYYSLVGRDLEYEIAPFTQDAGIGIMVWSPLASGFLTGKYTRENPTGNGGRLAGFDILPFDREHGYTVVDKLREIGAQHNASPAQVALAWLLSRPHVTSILIGASKMSQLHDNLGATSLELSTDEIATLDKLTEPRAIYPNWFNATIYDAQVHDALTKKNV
jgi:aryl-alcohol dehydrogenase-like predicted oxidoreductase